MDKKRPIHFNFDDRSLRTRAQLEAEGFILRETETLCGKLSFPTEPSLTAGDMPYAPVPTAGGYGGIPGPLIPFDTPQPPASGHPLPAPPLNTPYARLTQALWEHRLALTGTDVEARVDALRQVLWGIGEELDTTIETLRCQRGLLEGPLGGA